MEDNLEHCDCGKVAVWCYIPGHTHGNNYYCDDCVINKDDPPCSCNYKYISGFDEQELKEFKKLTEGIDYRYVTEKDLTDLYPTFDTSNFQERTVIYYIDEKGRPYPCAEYWYDEDGFEKDID
mgnify:CR=1 FL=1